MKPHKFYTNSQSAWSAMLAAIKQARRSIYWEIYILEDDLPPQFDFFQALLDRARNGVKVRIVLDGFGSLWLSGGTVDKLRSAGVEVLFFNKWFRLRLIHRKVLIVDDSLAFVGGVNVSKHYRKWLDLHLRLSGKRVIKSLVRSFSRSYFYSGGNDPDLLKLRKESKSRKTELWLLENFPWTGKLMLRPYYREQIALARKRVVLVTPYFIPHRWLVASLRSAMARGVSIEVVVPQKTDSRFIDLINHAFISALSKTGIKFYMTREMIHAKAILVDDRIGLVGSNNIDAMSFDYNAETGISFEKKEMIRDLANIIEIWKRDAILFRHDESHEKWYYRVLEKFAIFIQPIL